WGACDGECASRAAGGKRPMRFCCAAGPICYFGGRRGTRGYGHL
ncbi:MAG: hypothetical protein AVDCRST_MAG91-3757, partial [uncultured Sphingomonadaceae bacterium]